MLPERYLHCRELLQRVSVWLRLEAAEREGGEGGGCIVAIGCDPCCMHVFVLALEGRDTVRKT